LVEIKVKFFKYFLNLILIENNVDGKTWNGLTLPSITTFMVSKSQFPTGPVPKSKENSPKNSPASRILYIHLNKYIHLIMALFDLPETKRP